ncbi:hypothetical protein AAFN60_02590 [Roseibacillus persicicus]|uniref:Uncharacterized protein n=1 Tax=Roseibacillus persicicus TaxID=454148 RepID=A0A918TPJ0_9BACT|nr:hypothetical protein GCM10007100_20570 [Roseibacillus persicicus]
MNVRLFLSLSSAVLMGWMTASYFSAVPLDGYLSEETEAVENTEMAFNSADQSLVSAK